MSLSLLLLMPPSFSCPGVDRFLRSSNAGAFVLMCHCAIVDTRAAVHVHRARAVEEREYGAATQALKRASASNHHEVNHAAEGSPANIQVAGVIVYRVSRCICSKLNNALNMSARLECMALAQSARYRRRREVTRPSSKSRAFPPRVPVQDVTNFDSRTRA